MYDSELHAQLSSSPILEIDCEPTMTIQPQAILLTNILNVINILINSFPFKIIVLEKYVCDVHVANIAIFLCIFW